MAETYITLSSLKHYDEKIKEVVDEKQDQLVGTEGQVVSFDANGNVISKNIETINIDTSNFVEKEDGKGLSENNLTDELLEVINSDHTYAGFSSTTVTDLNNLQTEGMYNFSGAMTNAPFSLDRFTVEVFTYYRYVIQRAFGIKASTTSTPTTYMPTYYVRMYDTMLYSWTNWSLMSGTVATDGVLTSTSTNPVQNKVVYEALEKKVDKEELTEAITTAKSETIETILGEAVSEDFDTLKEIADWIQSDTTNSAELVTRVTNVENNLNKKADKTEIPLKVSQLANDNNYVSDGDDVHFSTVGATTFIGDLDGNAETATIAEKLSNTSVIGSSTKPVYFTADGVPTACRYNLQANVPEGAVFTDTVTTVTTTGTGNAITAISASNGAVTATKGSTFLTAHPTISKSTDSTSTASPAHGGTFTVVDSVTRDGNGHVTKVNTKTVTLPADNNTTYTHPTTSGNKHIPSGGSSGQILRWSADGTAVWGADNNTTYSAATTSANGLMTSTMVTKLNGIAEGANKYTLPTASSSTLGGVKTTSTVTSASGYTACPIISGVPYYKPTSGADANVYQSKYIAYDGVSSGSTGSIKWGSNSTISSSGSPTYVIGENGNNVAGASFVTGYYTQSNNAFCMVIGKFNKLTTNNDAHRYVSWMANQKEDINTFVIGNGTSDGARSNAFRVTARGVTYGLSAFNSSGADYAEFVSEWADGNPDWEDRVGYFVTLKDDKLYKANNGDYILGITSGNPSVVGNGDETYFWMYERDEFNRFVYVDTPIIDENGKEIIDENGNVIAGKAMKISDSYDPTREYIARKDRSEWDYVGMTGVIPVRDDGTCVANGYCKCGVDGVATISTEKGDFTYFVKERISDNVISVIMR